MESAGDSWIADCGQTGRLDFGDIRKLLADEHSERFFAGDIEANLAG
jgi:hypothetical protein